MKSMDYDIAIVGGGMIGASLALALRHLSLRIVVIEAIAAPQRLDDHFDARSISLSPSSQRIFAGMDLWSALRPFVLPIEHIHVSDKGHFWANRFHAADEDLPALGYMIEAQHLNHQLHQQCQEAATMTWLSPAKLTDVSCTPQGVELQLMTEEGNQSLTCRLLIAADGQWSQVRKLQQIEHQQWDYQQSALVANIGLARSHGNTAYERFTAQGPMALLPLSQQRSALVWTLPPKEIDYYLKLPEAQFLAVLQQTFGYRLGRFVKVGKRAMFPLQLVLAADSTAESLVLVGNAAQTIHPVAGQGFNLGLRDVATLATIISEALATKVAINHPSVLKQYQQQRRWDRRQVIALSDGLTRLYSNRHLPYAILRACCMLGMDALPPARRLLLKHSMGLAGCSADLACGLPLERYDEVV